MKKNGRRWGIFAILLSAVLASGPIGATTIECRQEPALLNLEPGSLPLSLSDRAYHLALPDGPTFQLPETFLHTIPTDNTLGKGVLGSLVSPPPTAAGPKSEGRGVATDFQSSHLRLSEREMAVWKSNGEPEDWLFRMQFAKASSFELPEPAPLIPIPEPTTGGLVLMGLAGRALWAKYARL